MDLYLAKVYYKTTTPADMIIEEEGEDAHSIIVRCTSRVAGRKTCALFFSGVGAAAYSGI